MHDNILAKREPPETLVKHTENVLSVFDSVRKAYPRIPILTGVPEFYRNLFYAVCLHDLGKAALGFQVRWGNWGYRHEILSAGLVKFIPELDDITKRAIGLAIISHHKNLNDLKIRFNTTMNSGKENFLEKRDEFYKSIDYIRWFFSLIPAWSEKYLNSPVIIDHLPNCPEDIEDSYRLCVSWFLTKLEDEELTALHSSYGIFMRGLLIACDHLASAGKNGILEGIKGIDKKLNLRNFRTFQQMAGKSDTSSFLCAPTGSGKTEAGLLWANNNQNGEKRIYYVLPYTASINAMYKRFERIFGKENVGVLHGKAQYFIYKMLMEEGLSSEAAALNTKELNDLTKKLYRPVKILTPYQIIKSFFAVKGWEASIAEMSGSLFIFDEIHVYDAHITALLLGIFKKLNELDCKMLFISATFPRFLKERIIDILPDIPEIRLDLSNPDDNKLLTNPRHQIDIIKGGIMEHIKLINDEVRSGKRVLVVCNTVKQAQDVFNEFDIEDKELLHGRFILRDRESIENRILKNIPNLLIATQVIEVSLDLDFDTIFTEPAPIDALIQRFGRVNRKGTKGIVPVRIFTKGSEKDKYFYNPERIEKTLNVLTDKLYLNETVIESLVEEVYRGGYNSKESEMFNSAANSFKRILDNLVPFIDSEEKDEFYELIKSYQVVPAGEIEQEYLQLIEQNNFFDAMRCFANISVGQGMRLQKLQVLTLRKIHLHNKDHTYYVADTPYSPAIGLQLEPSGISGVFID